MTGSRTFVLTLLAMLAFAGNSLLCRAALAGSGTGTNIDPASFTLIRIASGAAVLGLIVRSRGVAAPAGGRGSWLSALALFAYASAFSYAYVELTAATGALLVFGAVQATMIGWGLWRGERLGFFQVLGLVCALAGLAGLLLPGVAAPPPVASLLMIGAGIAWGIYSLRGRGAGDPLRVTAGNFLRALAPAAALSAATLAWAVPDGRGAAWAVASGALTSGVGYAVWYAALPGLKATTAATVQLSVPLIAAVGGIALLGEAPSLRLLAGGLAILGGIGLVIIGKRKPAG